VDPVPNPLLLRKSGSAGNLTRISESVARNYDHWTTAVVQQEEEDGRSAETCCEVKG
jgi:hypothetical protein